MEACSVVLAEFFPLTYTQPYTRLGAAMSARVVSKNVAQSLLRIIYRQKGISCHVGAERTSLLTASFSFALCSGAAFWLR